MAHPLQSDAEPVAFEALVPPSLRNTIVVIPAELVSLHVLSLPVRAARQRAAALPFAIEGELGQALSTTHVALCGEGGAPGEILAAAVATEVMHRYRDALPGREIVPEQLLVPRPGFSAEGGAQWICYAHAGRALVRGSDGSGFAARTDMLPTLWHLAGTPDVQSFGDPLPRSIGAQHSGSALPAPPRVQDLTDLRQGAFRPARGLARPLKWLAAASVIGAIGHLGLAAADAAAQRTIADSLQARAQSALTAQLPDADADQPPALIQRRLAAMNEPIRGSAFLPVMHRVSTTLAALPDAVTFRQLTWSPEALRITLEAPDLDALQRAEAGLGAEGLRVSSGSATAEAGSARADLTVRP
ncbi:hypothetical protein KDD17_01575 [Sulfitobacter albidus]|uniref:GspL cytoplasmic actin-ATPase-like domain-containing protein n=1 Tax=Sulfitobacter albidus TaxID=2829501 RepID=A0A975JEI6_9RHOB|nr:type II secretion system protein GspL [Sulfitobacter albidus]QUJ76781.1 hypothetical protein KDD17_01575 [Sulfitobacter albidus]